LVIKRLVGCITRLPVDDARCPSKWSFGICLC
jgi:hypothetical protein